MHKTITIVYDSTLHRFVVTESTWTQGKPRTKKKYFRNFFKLEKFIMKGWKDGKRKT